MSSLSVQKFKPEETSEFPGNNGIRLQDFYCDKCGIHISRKTWHYSYGKFYRPLCYKCQSSVRKNGGSL